MKSLTGEELDPRTVDGDKPAIRCSHMMLNQTQCPRPAVIGKHSDPENREALCSVCFTLLGLPAGYQKEIGRQ